MSNNTNNNKATLNGIHRSLGRLEGSVSSGFQSVNARLDKINSTVETHNVRINKVESEQDKTKGIATILGGIAGAIIIGIKYALDKALGK